MRQVREIIESDVKDLARFYCFKTIEELNAQLLNDGKANINRFPFIFLLNNLKEEKISFWQKEVDFTIYICASTLAKYNDKQRDDLIYQTKLYPLYDSILHELNRDFGIVNTHIEDITTTKIYYNSINSLGFTEIIDCLQVDFKKVKFWI